MCTKSVIIIIRNDFNQYQCNFLLNYVVKMHAACAHDSVPRAG